MLEVKLVFPVNIKRPAAYAVRTFPKGCGIKSNPKPTPPPPLPSAELEKPLKIDADVDATSETSSSLKVREEEIKVSNPSIEPPKDSEKVGVENVVGDEGTKVNGHVEEELCGSKRRFDDNMEVLARISKEFFANKRRKVWAVRDFPAGCGRAGTKINRKAANSEAASVASSESKVVNDEKKDNEVKMKVGESSKKAEDEVRKKDAEPDRETIRETVGETSVKSPKVKSLDGEKKKFVGIGTSSTKEIEDEVKVEASVKTPKGNSVDVGKKKPALADDLSVRYIAGEGKKDESNERQVRAKEVSSEATVKSTKMNSLGEEKKLVAKPKSAMEGPSRVRHEVKKNETKKIRVNAQQNSSKGQNNSPLKSSSGEGSLDDRNEEKQLIIYPLEKLERHDVKQVEKNLQVNELQDPREKPVGKGLIKGPKDGMTLKRKLQEEEEDDGSLEAYGDRLIVQSLMAAENCPWRKSKKSGGISSRSVTPGSKAKKKQKLLGNNFAIVPFQHNNRVDDEDSLPQDGANEMALTIYNKSRKLSVTMTPSVPPGLLGKGCSSEEVVSRNKVKKALRLFQLITRKLLQGEEAKLKGKLLLEGKSKDNSKKRVDLEAASILKNSGEWMNCRGKRREAILGAVPGVEVGDEFHYRVELSIIGLHRPFQAGIDYVKKQGVVLATSIVASGGYPDDTDNSDVLIYSGSGGNAAGGGDKQAEDQKLERGNLALKNSIDAQTPVRVVYGSKELSKSDSSDVKAKMVSTFTYDGLYLVEKYWTEQGPNGYNIFKFQLRRMPGQPEVALKEVTKTKKMKVREGLCVKDISDGKERTPICAVNTVDNDLPMPFKYITKVIYPSSSVIKPPRGCDCTDGCSDSEKCACAVKNGGEIPYNYNGAIVQAKPLIYECGPSCNCPPSCYNRVSQHGIRQPLEIFKTKSRGWGVRSLYSIPSGTFICEYMGEMLEEAEAEQRINDEYLFDIGHNYDDHALWDGLPSILSSMQSSSAHETVENVGCTIDAANYGNAGRFINHSCSPNLYAQNVLFDHDDKRMPHIMFFAIDNIPPLQELTYHYNYQLDQVRDSEGNIKKKECFCGSPECSGRLY